MVLWFDSVFYPHGPRQHAHPQQPGHSIFQFLPFRSMAAPLYTVTVGTASNAIDTTGTGNPTRSSQASYTGDGPATSNVDRRVRTGSTVP